MKGFLYMGPEVIDSFLIWQKVCSDEWNFPDASTIHTTNTVVAMLLYSFDMVRYWMGWSGSSHCEGNPSLCRRVGFSRPYVKAFEKLGSNYILGIGIAILFGEACANNECDIDIKGLDVEDSLL